VVSRQNADIADTLHIGDVAKVPFFRLFVYGVCWKETLNSN